MDTVTDDPGTIEAVDEALTQATTGDWRQWPRFIDRLLDERLARS